MSNWNEMFYLIKTKTKNKTKQSLYLRDVDYAIWSIFAKIAFRCREKVKVIICKITLTPKKKE